ncbi:MAG: YfhO family protein [Bacteroidales bacterium]|nr:YfhO family protein [Bacteroidales bacterium]
MKETFNFKSILPYAVSILLFLIISVIYFTPEMFEGKTLFQGDTQQGIAINQEVVKYAQQTGETSRWTNTMFGGMPTFQTSPSYAIHPVLRFIENAYRLWLPAPASLIFSLLLGFWILMLSFKTRKDVAFFGAVMFAFSSYYFILIDAGHLWKLLTIIYIPPTIAGILLTYRGKYLLGGVSAAFFAALQIHSNHVQMTYYFLFVILFIVIGYFFHLLKRKELPRFFKASAILIVSALLAVGINSSNLYHTYQYSKQTMRGGSELVSNGTSTPEQMEVENAGGKINKSSGLNRDYITQWSYGIDETLSLMIPNVKGGFSGVLSQNKKAISNAKPQYREYFNQFNQYWGDQPFTSGPVYVGAFVMFLFILGLFIVKGWLKYSLLAATILSIVLAWGKNFMAITDLFIDFVPMYNKFRAVSSALVIAEFTIPLLAALALMVIINKPSIIKEKKYDFYASAALTAGVCLILALFPETFLSFFSAQETVSFLPQAKQQPQLMELFDNIKEARVSIFISDAWRSFIIITLGILAIIAFSKNKLKARNLVIFVTVLTLFDLWQVDKRYLNNSKFVPKKETSKMFAMTEADKMILQDKDPNYRVFNLTTDPFNDANTSYYHKSIGGYHAAKLQRYQDIIDYHLSKNINMNVVDMLNTKYLIVNGENNKPIAQFNPDALGNVWFVDSIDWANNANQEINALNDFNPRTTAIIDVRFKKDLSSLNIVSSDSLSKIKLESYSPNKLVYKSNSKEDALAVFSEIYYPDGWKATIDGIDAPIVRANYILRALAVPKGDHTIEFTFKPASIDLTNTISFISFGIIILGAIIILIYKRKNKNIKNEN